MNKIYILAIITYFLVVASGLFFHHVAILSTIGAPSTPQTVAIQSGLAPTTAYPFWQIALDLIVGLAIALILVRFIGKIVMRGYGYLIFGLTFYILLDGIATVFYPQMPLLVFLGIMIVAFLFYWKTHKKLLNFFAVLVSVIGGGYFGFSYSPLIMAIVFAGFCVYDLVAVFGTDIMGDIVKDAVGNYAPIFIYSGNYDDLKAKASNVSLVKKKTGKQTKTTTAGLLGVGDLVIAGALCASMAVYVNPLLGGFLALGAIIGLYLNVTVSRKRGLGLPALPLLFASQMAIIGIWFSPLFLPLLFIAPIFLIVVFEGIDKLAVWKSNRIKKAQKKKV